MIAERRERFGQMVLRLAAAAAQSVDALAVAVQAPRPLTTTNLYHHELVRAGVLASAYPQSSLTGPYVSLAALGTYSNPRPKGSS